MQLSEEEFLKRIDEHKGMICKVSRIYFERKEDQQDLAQEIVLQCWKSLGSFKGKSAFSTWLYRIAINTAIVYFKKETKRKDNAEFRSVEFDVAREDSADETDQLKTFYKAIYQLSKIEKAIILQYIDGLPGREISQRMGMTEVNVRVKLSRIKKKLQERLRDDHGI